MTDRPRSFTDASQPRKPLITILAPKKKQSKNFTQPLKQPNAEEPEVMKEKQSCELKKKKFLRVFSSQQDFHNKQKQQANTNDNNNVDIMVSLRKYLHEKIKVSNQSTTPSQKPTDTPIEKLYIFDQLKKNDENDDEFKNNQMQLKDDLNNQQLQDESCNRIDLIVNTVPTKISHRKTRCKIFPITRRESFQRANNISMNVFTPKNDLRGRNILSKMMTQRDIFGGEKSQKKIHILSGEKIKIKNQHF